MRILSKKKIDEIIVASYNRGHEQGFKKGKRDGAENERKKQQKDIISKFEEASVTIESVRLKSLPRIKERGSFYGWYEEFTLATYEVKFRSVGMKKSATIEMEFETPDFSMADVRRRITQVFCECKNDKGGR